MNRPQCSPSAIQHLVSSTNSTHLVYHEMYTDLAKAFLNNNKTSCHLIKLPSRAEYETPSVPRSENQVSDAIWTSEDIARGGPDLVSHVFHTSGTSGTPKPIPQTHLGAVTPLPRRALPTYISSPDSNTEFGSSNKHSKTSDRSDSFLPPAESAAFTTTPIFHGGVSDLLRAWMARSMIYFYPTSEVGITTENVVAAVDACDSSTQGQSEQERGREHRCKVTSFLSVPYILTILSEDLEGKGMEILRRMDVVSTGGAPLDTVVGDKMVERGVRLVSRLGSSECGCECNFLWGLRLKSADYDDDDTMIIGWQ